MNEHQIIKEYKNGSSSLELAKKYNTYQNKILRILKKHGETPRSKSEAQKLALKEGRTEHPTEGKVLDSKTRARQSESQAKRWKRMPQTQRDALREGAVDRWENRSELSKQNMLSEAGRALQKASKEGSKTEKFLCKSLRNAGYEVIPHKTGLIPGNYELDIFLPAINTIIEIDGPQHFLPIFGEDSLKKHIAFDNIKNGLLIKEGFTILRVKFLVKHLSQKIHRDLWNVVKQTLDNISSGKNINKLIEVEVSG